MNMKSISVFIMVAFVISCDHSPAKTDHSDSAIVDSVLTEYRQAWLNDDSAKVLSTLSDSIILFVPGSTPHLKGKIEVKEFWFPQTDIKYPIRKYEISDQEIYTSSNMAFVQGRSILSWETVKDGSVIKVDTSTSDFITIMKFEEGNWKIFQQMYQPK